MVPWKIYQIVSSASEVHETPGQHTPRALKYQSKWGEEVLQLTTNEENPLSTHSIKFDQAITHFIEHIDIAYLLTIRITWRITHCNWKRSQMWSFEIDKLSSICISFNGQKIVVYRKWLKTNYLSLCLSLTFELWMDCIHNAAINNATNAATEVTPWTLNINEKYFTLFVLVLAYWNAYWMKSQKV